MFRLLGEREIGDETRFVRPVIATFEGPDGATFERFVVRSPGAVGVVPLRIDSARGPVVTLLRQYRPALDAWLWELPAGMRDVDGEPPEETGRRELIEEAGLSPRTIEPVCGFHNSAGMTDSFTHVFVATDLDPVPASAQSIEETVMEVHDVSLDDAIGMIERGEITDAKTIIGLLLVARRLDR
jgi:8-oxo-dGDP phosphatase